MLLSLNLLQNLQKPQEQVNFMGQVGVDLGDFVGK